MEGTEQAQLHHTELSSACSPATMWLQLSIGRSLVLFMGPNWTCCSRGDSGAGEEAVCCRQLSLQGRTQAQAPCPRAVIMGKQEDLCSEAQAYIIPLEPDIRQLVPSTNTMEPNKFGGGESTARPYPLLGNNSQAENHKSPWQGTKEK